MWVIYLASNKNVVTENNVRDSVDDCAEINSLAINAAPETTGVTSFVQEASTCVEAVSEAVDVGTYVPLEGDIQDLTKYFSRPVAITNGNMPYINTNIFSTAYSDFSNVINVFPNATNRLIGVYGMRATIVYTLQVATTPFHQGMLVMSFQYGETDTSLTYIRSTHNAMCTNLPHVRLDLSTDTMVQLRVPFLYTKEYAPIRGGQAPVPYGTFALNSILTVNSVPGQLAPHYQIYMHLEDIQFFGAAPLATTNLVFQSGKKLAPITEEFEKESHPYSSGTMALSRAVHFLTKGIPMLSSIGGPTSWFLAKSAGAIRSFGFSKPTIVDPPQRMVRHGTVLEHNVDVPSMAVVVGPFAGNTLRVSPKFGGTDVDEMSLAYVLSNYCQVARFYLSINDALGALVYAAPLCPGAMWFRSSASNPIYNILPLSVAPASTNAFLPTNLFYFGQMFRWWKGGFKFRFTFGKAKMHGGRVMVVFNPIEFDADEFTYLQPGTSLAAPVASYGTNGPDPFGYSAIFNLRDGNVFEFDVPYISPRGYHNFISGFGTLAMYVVDPLQASSVLAPAIQVMVEVKAAEDFEFANLRTALYPAHVSGTPQFQSGRLLSNTRDNVSELTMGEAVTSLKQVISIPKVTSTTIAAGAKLQFYPQPWFYTPRYSVLTPAPTAHLTEAFSNPGMVAKAFAYVKGGTDLHVYADTYNNSHYQVIRQTNYRGTATQCPAQQPFSNNAIVVQPEGNGHYRLPIYQQYARLTSSCLDGIVATGSAWGINGSRNPVPPSTTQHYGLVTNYAFVGNFPSASTVFVSRAASDDAGAAGFLGPVPLTLLSTNTAATLYDVDSVYANF